MIQAVSILAEIMREKRSGRNADTGTRSWLFLLPISPSAIYKYIYNMHHIPQLTYLCTRSRTYSSAVVTSTCGDVNTLSEDDFQVWPGLACPHETDVECPPALKRRLVTEREPSSFLEANQICRFAANTVTSKLHHTVRPC